MATSPNRLAGVCFVTVDGKSYAIAGAGAYRVNQETRESLLGQDGYHGYKAMPAAGMMSWTGRDGNGLSIKTLADTDNGTVVFELANGKVIVGRNMVRTGEPVAVNTEEGSYEIVWEGPEVTEN